MLYVYNIMYICAIMLFEILGYGVSKPLNTAKLGALRTNRKLGGN